MDIVSSLGSIPGMGSLTSMLGMADQSTERFNNVLLEFLLKFKRVSKLQQEEAAKVDKILQLAKDNNPLPLTLFKSVLNEEIKVKIQLNDASFLAGFSFLPFSRFEELSPKSKKSVFKYLKKLVRIATITSNEQAGLAELGEKIPAMLASIDWERFGEELFEMLTKIRNIMAKYKISEELFAEFIGDIIGTAPALGNIDVKKFKEPVSNFLIKLFFRGLDIEKKRNEEKEK